MCSPLASLETLFEWTLICFLYSHCTTCELVVFLGGLEQDQTVLRFKVIFPKAFGIYLDNVRQMDLIVCQQERKKEKEKCLRGCPSFLTTIDKKFP